MKRNSQRKSKENLADNIERDGMMLNGFTTIKEGPALSCRESNVAQFTLPQEALVFQPQSEDTVCLFKNGDKERKIHNNIKLDEKEQADLLALQQEAKEQNCAFLPSITAMATRFLSRARGDPKKAVTLMQATQDWRLEYFKAGPVADEQVEEDLKHGIVYFTGRDSALRPTIVVRPKRIPQEWYKLKCIDRMIRVLIFCMEYMMFYMLLPGRIENTNVIIDLKGLGLSQIPISAIGDMMKVMSHHYIGRVFKFYVVNLSWTLNTLSVPVKAFLTDRQKQKLCILDDVKALAKDFAPHHLEEDLGGTRPIITKYFPFPLLPGPFDKENKSGPSKDAVPNSHVLLANAQAARQGRLWDSSKSAVENANLDYSEEAHELFRRCNYPIPDNCPRPNADSPKAAVSKESNGEEAPAESTPTENNSVPLPSKSMRASLKEMGITCVDLTEEPEDAEKDNVIAEFKKADTATTNTQGEIGSDFGEEDDGELQDEEVKPGGFFWCRSCTMGSATQKTA
jgi:hypothetical protein